MYRKESKMYFLDEASQSAWKEAIFFTALNKEKNPHKKSSKRNKMSEKKITFILSLIECMCYEKCEKNLGWKWKDKGDQFFHYFHQSC